jgi:hypothetical protein
VMLSLHLLSLSLLIGSFTLLTSFRIEYISFWEDREDLWPWLVGFKPSRSLLLQSHVYQVGVI